MVRRYSRDLVIKIVYGCAQRDRLPLQWWRLRRQVAKPPARASEPQAKTRPLEVRKAPFLASSHVFLTELALNKSEIISSKPFRGQDVLLLMGEKTAAVLYSVVAIAAVAVSCCCCCRWNIYILTIVFWLKAQHFFFSRRTTTRNFPFSLGAPHRSIFRAPP